MNPEVESKTIFSVYVNVTEKKTYLNENNQQHNLILKLFIFLITYIIITDSAIYIFDTYIFVKRGISVGLDLTTRGQSCDAFSKGSSTQSTYTGR